MGYILVLGLATIGMALLLPKFVYVATKNQHDIPKKLPRRRFSSTSAPSEIDQSETEVQAALADIDPDDAAALLGRCNAVMDDIHGGRF
jgi:hypothetical protein